MLMVLPCAEAKRKQVRAARLHREEAAIMIGLYFKSHPVEQTLMSLVHDTQRSTVGPECPTPLQLSATCLYAASRVYDEEYIPTR
jgi:hypothetical protein